MLANVFTKTTMDRWRSMVIGSAVIGVLLMFGMVVYRDIDLSLYTDLPEAFRSLVNIPVDADVASLAYGAIYGSYGALTLAGIVISMGSASIAGEERDGTIGLLFGNPKSRTYVLASKAGSMVLLAVVGTGILWAAARITPELIDVNVSGMQIEALMLHMFVSALFYGFLAMAVGGWTGSRGLASGVAAGVMVFSLFAAGLLPLVEGWENAAKVFPWYYFVGSDPVINGVDWSHIAVLGTGIVVFGVLAFVGLNRRDLKGHTVGVTLVDRLRANPTTQRFADQLAGSTRVSAIWVKTASERQGLALVVALIMFAFMGMMIGPMYTLIDEALKDFSDVFPETLLALFGGGDMSTPEGFYQIETFGLMAPIAVMVVTIAVGSHALAGEEQERTMGLLLANPVSRSTIVLEKAVAMLLLGAIVGLSIFAGVAAGSVAGRLGMSIGHIASTSLLVTLLGFVMGAAALVLSAGTGRTKVATFGAVGIALTSHVLNALLPLSESLEGLATWTPSYYYLTNDPLNNGMDWGHATLLAVLTVALIGLSVVLFQRHDLRQTG